MSNKASIIDIRNIIFVFAQSTKGFEWLFRIMPIIVGLVLPVIMYGQNSYAVDILNSFLTSFVPLFATILTFYLSWCYNKIKTRHNTERLTLFRETSTNILMMIPLDVTALICSTLAGNMWFSNCYLPTIQDTWQPLVLISKFFGQFTWHQVLRYIFLTCFYTLIIEIILIVFMVCKRAFVIINNEISLITDVMIDDSTQAEPSLERKFE